MNDPREIVLGLGRIRPILEDIVSQHKAVWNIDLCRRTLERTYESIKNNDFFTCSFSQTGDSMPMWRHYGEDGAGLAIGFRPRAITDFPCRIQRVDYVSSRSTDEELRVTVTDVLDRYAGLKGDTSQVREIEISSTILALCTGTKHSTWDHEREVRGVYAQTSAKESVGFLGGVTSLHSDGSEFKWQEPLERGEKGSEIRYLSFPYGKRSKSGFDYSGAVAEVIVGSKSPISSQEVSDLLLSEGYRNFQVLQSECVWI